jgi:hypothetical protein
VQEQKNGESTKASSWCPDIYSSNEDNQMLHLVTMDSEHAKDMVLVPVQNTRRNHMFMFSKRTKSLHIYNIELESVEEELQAFTFDQLDRERCVTIIPHFDYHPKVKYFLNVDTLLYSWKGNLVSRNVVTGQKKEIKFESKIVNNDYIIYAGSESLQVLYRTADDHICFTDLYWMNEKVLSYQICKNQSVLNTQVEFDAINNQFATFVSPTVIFVFPNLGETSIDAEGTMDFKKRFIACTINRHPLSDPSVATDPKMNTPQMIDMQKYLCPSEFVANLCALDAVSNSVKVWSVGTGHFLYEKPLLPEEGDPLLPDRHQLDFTGF